MDANTISTQTCYIAMKKYLAFVKPSSIWYCNLEIHIMSQFSDECPWPQQRYNRILVSTTIGLNNNIICSNNKTNLVLRRGLQDWRKKSLTANVCRLVYSSAMYNIWRNRNEIEHGSRPKTEEKILQTIILWEVKARIWGRGRFRKAVENVGICCNWGINEQILV